VTLKLNEIALADVLHGRNWIATKRVETLTAESVETQTLFKLASKFESTSYVLYSGLCVRPSGRATALLLFKQVGSVEYGGIYWQLEDGRWKRVGEEPDPHYEVGTREFIADPSASDPSFDSPDHDYRGSHREGFQANVGRLAGGSRH